MIYLLIVSTTIAHGNTSCKIPWERLSRWQESLILWLLFIMILSQMKMIIRAGLICIRIFSNRLVFWQGSSSLLMPLKLIIDMVLQKRKEKQIAGIYIKIFDMKNSKAMLFFWNKKLTKIFIFKEKYIV